MPSSYSSSSQVASMTDAFAWTSASLILSPGSGPGAGEGADAVAEEEGLESSPSDGEAELSSRAKYPRGEVVASEVVVLLGTSESRSPSCSRRVVQALSVETRPK
jgi:hypothetical protein